MDIHQALLLVCEVQLYMMTCLLQHKLNGCGIPLHYRARERQRNNVNEKVKGGKMKV